MINTTVLKVEDRKWYRYLASFYEHAVEIFCLVELSMKMIYNLGAWYKSG